MKNKALTLMLMLLGIVAASPQTSAQSASGTYQFALDDGYTKYAEFDARGPGDGSATGQLTFTDEAKIEIQDLDGTGDPTGTIGGYYIKAEFDGIVVDKNDAVMSGTIRDSSVRELIGQRVLLTVEDNGDNTRVLDHLTWGLYRPVVRNWIPSDAELKDDPGVGLRWIATDAERKDDRGVQMPLSEAIETDSFPVTAYELPDVKSAGDIIVRP